MSGRVGEWERGRERECVCVVSLCMWKLFDSTLLLPSPHTHAQACELDMTFEEKFQEIMQRVVVVVAESNTQGITVPSLRGVFHHAVFPQPPLAAAPHEEVRAGMLCLCVCVCVCMFIYIEVCVCCADS